MVISDQLDESHSDEGQLEKEVFNLVRLIEILASPKFLKKQDSLKVGPKGNVVEDIIEFLRKDLYQEAAVLTCAVKKENTKIIDYLLKMAVDEKIKKNHNITLKICLLSSLVAPESPLPYLHAAESYIALENKVQALAAVEMAISCVNEQKYLQKIMEKLFKMREHLKK